MTPFLSPRFPLASDLPLMRRALALARRGLGRTTPNPCVGAVIARGGRVLGEGWHRAAGQPHAEIAALRDARRRGHRDLRRATLYVTLEPCSTHGRTPPCTEAILAAGLRRVVVGAVDPFPAHRGRGLRLLRRHGVRVARGLLAEECAALNAAWNRWIVTRRPWVLAKIAQTLDGKIATASGESRWITGARARRIAHCLRAESDAVLVGVGTLLADDPALTARDARGNLLPHQAMRIILDSTARTPPRARALVAPGGKTWIVTTARAPAARIRRLEAAGAAILRLPAREGRPDPRVLLRHLGRHDIIRVLLEGGGETLASFFEAGLVDEVAFFLAPRILGGTAARRAVAGRGFRFWRLGPRIGDLRLTRLGADLLVRGRVIRATPPRRRSRLTARPPSVRNRTDVPQARTRKK